MAITVPTYDVPDVEPNAPKPAYAEYGAGPGRAIEGLGNAPSGAADELTRRSIALQDQQNAVVAQQKVMAGQQKVIDASYGDHGIATATGIAAQGMTQRTQDLLNSTLADMTQGTTPAQERLIQGMWGRFSIGRIESAAQRELTIHQSTVKDTAAAMIGQQRDVAEHDPANDASVQSAAQQAANAWDLANPGASAAMRADGMAAARSHVFQGAILSRSASDPMGAAAMLTTYGPQLYGHDLLDTQTHLRPLVQRAQVAAFEQGLRNGAPPAGASTGNTSPDAVAARIPVVESGGHQLDPKTGEPLVSMPGDPDSPVGTWQVKPSTGRVVAGQLGLPWDEGRLRNDPAYNSQIGRAYFDQMTARYGGNTLLGAAAYNAGPGNVDSWIKQLGDPRTGAISAQDFAARIPAAETRKYVQSVGAVPRSQPTSGYMAVGDSLAYGLQTAGGLPGTGKEKASPFQVYQQVQALPADQVRGKTILLSSGVSNNPGAIGLVDQQIAELKAKGAAEVRLVGVGDRADFAGLNEQLAAAASRSGAVFTGPVTPGDDHVHPRDYPGTLKALQGAGPAGAGPPPSAAPPATLPSLDQLTERAREAAHGDPVLEDQMINAATRYYHKQETQAVAGFEQSLAPVDQRANGAPDLDDWYEQAHQYAASHGGDPALEQRLMAAASAKYNQWHAQTRVERDQLTRSLPGTQASLEAGLDVPIPEQQIRTYLPASQADDVLGKLAVSQIAGQAFKSIDLATPDQLAATMTDLSSGLGTYSQQIRLRLGRASGPGMVSAGGEAADDPTGAARGVNAVTGESGEQFQLRRQVLSKFASLVSAREAVLNGPQGDPAAYVAARDPVVQQRLQAAQQNPNDAGAQQAYEGALLAEQQALGVRQPRLLSNDQVAQQVGELTKLDPAKDSVTNRLDAMATRFGDQWPQAFGELVRVGKLNPQYQTLATMTQPSQLVARDDLQRALGMISEAKGGFSHLEQAAPQKTGQDINNKIDDAMSEFRASTRYNSGGVDLFENVRNSVKTLAFYYATRDGLDGTQAVTKATDAIIGQKYEFDGSMRVPKGMLGQAEAATARFQSGLSEHDIQPFQGTAPGLTPADRAHSTLQAAQRGFWAPNEDDTGLVLVGRLMNGGFQKIMLSNGTPAEVRFNALPAAAPSQAGTFFGTIDSMR